MEELHFTGNCLKGSRPILSFDSAFDQQPHLRLLKELFTHVFGVPPGSRRSKPFVDHVMGFSIADGKVWVRNYQINEIEAGKADEDMEDEEPKSKPKVAKGGSKDTDVELIEIGPRFVLTPIVIQEGSFGGPIIYENKQFVSPNQVRSELRKKKAERHNVRTEQQHDLVTKRESLGLRTTGEKKTDTNGFDAKALFA